MRYWLAHDVLRAFDLARLVPVTLDRKTGGSLLAPRYLERLNDEMDRPKIS